MHKQITNIAGYQFVEIDDVKSVHNQLQSIGGQTHLKGTVFISPEGINVSLAGSQTDIDFAILQMKSRCGFQQLMLNFTYSPMIPFKRLLIKIRDELVTTRHRLDNVTGTKAGGKTALADNSTYITSATLKQWLDDDRDFTLLDLRNGFEYELGSFNHARHLKLKHFRELGNSIKKLGDIPKDKPVVTFCTGGIRCEKGAPFIAEQGFDQVFQLKGGILDYLSTLGDNHWRGNCFVFDERISLNSRLHPTYTRLCRNCQTSLQKEEKRLCATCADLV